MQDTVEIENLSLNRHISLISHEDINDLKKEPHKPGFHFCKKSGHLELFSGVIPLETTRNKSEKFFTKLSIS